MEKTEFSEIMNSVLGPGDTTFPVKTTSTRPGFADEHDDGFLPARLALISACRLFDVEAGISGRDGLRCVTIFGDEAGGKILLQYASCRSFSSSIFVMRGTNLAAQHAPSLLVFCAKKQVGLDKYDKAEISSVRT
jgi:hypothetical protein